MLLAGNMQDFDQDKFIENQCNKIKQNMAKVISVLRKQFPNCTLYTLATVPRKNWYPVIVDILLKFNKYMRHDMKMKVCQISGYIMNKHWDDEEVHFLHEGYRLFVSKGLGPLLNYQVRTHKRDQNKAEHVPKNMMSRSAKIRLNKKK